ncbi:MAG: adenylosuccinate lyase [Candidatus Kerfeldbacteria bacterium]|nr:adenylosuccinate lyase [Candidatus Kerfeldbacteria bacterium]
MPVLWSDQAAKQGWLEVELAVLRARAELGQLPDGALPTIVGALDGYTVDLQRLAEFEAEFDHDMIAFIVTVQERLRAAGAGRYAEEFHRGLTSYDVEDPASMRQLRQAVVMDRDALIVLQLSLKDMARKHRTTFMIGRTHGQYAEPISFGHLLLVFAEEIGRSVRRLEYCLAHELNEGKISGAVGSYGGMDPRVEALALGFLNLVPARAETQILQRDRHAAVLSALATAAASIEQICRTFWEMMCSDVGELQEPRRPKQRGSSAMAHKRNPILTERLQGMARLVRADALCGFENVATPECRDISESSVGRHVYPRATTYVHYMAITLAVMVQKLDVFPYRMRQRLEEGTRSVWASQAIRNALMEKGVSYDRAYEVLQGLCQTAVETGTDLRRLCRGAQLEPDGPTIERLIGPGRLANCFDIEAYLGPGLERMFGPMREPAASAAG